MTDTNQQPQLDCPQCGKTITWSEKYPERPFCSQRCRELDFGAWATESYYIPGEPTWVEEMEDDDMDENTRRYNG